MTVAEQDAGRGASHRVGLLVLAVIFLGIAGYMGLESYHILSTYDQTQGRLVKIEKFVGRKSIKYIGTIDFVAKNGQTFQTEIGGAGSMFVGASVPVLYDRTNPNRNRANDTNSLWGYPLAAGGLGLVLLIIGLLSPGGPRTSSGERTPATDTTTPSLASAFSTPGKSPWQPTPRPVQVDHQPRKRSRLVRVFFGLVWTVVFFFVSGVIAAVVSVSGAGSDPALQKQMAEQAGATTGPWVILGSMTLAIVLAFMGLLPGTRRTRR